MGDKRKTLTAEECEAELREKAGDQIAEEFQHLWQNGRRLEAMQLLRTYDVSAVEV